MMDIELRYLQKFVVKRDHMIEHETLEDIERREI